MPAFAEEEAIAVRVGDLTYTVTEVQQYADKTASQVQDLSGMTLAQLYEENTEVSYLTDAAEHFVTVGLTELKARELGLDQLTAEEEEALRAYAREYYEALWQQLKTSAAEAYPDLSGDDLEKAISKTLEDTGYTLDSLFREAYLALLEQRLADHFCPEITVTDEEVTAYYQENCVDPDLERYENDLDLFEQNVLMNGENSFYVPYGYFYLQYIVLEPVAKVSGPVTDAEYALLDAQELLQSAQTTLNLAALETGETAMEDAVAAYQEAARQVQGAETALSERKTEAEAQYIPFHDLIAEAMANGETFDALVERYSVYAKQNPEDFKGTPFHPNSSLWDERLRAEAASLEKTGDLSEPVYVGGNILLLCRGEDIPGGPYEPDAETFEEMKDSLLLQKQTERLDTFLAEWRQDVNIEIDISGLTMPSAR